MLETNATCIPKGIAAKKTMGYPRQRASTTPEEGNNRSRYFAFSTQIDYARGVSLDVLLVAEPGFEPVYAKPGDAGADLKSTDDLVLAPRSRALVKTGVRIAMPEGFVALVHPRSGLAAKHGITVLNTPGTVDAGYRGEIMVTLYNSSDEPFEIHRGDRIAQIVFQAVETATFHAVSQLPESSRGDTGFGSSGRN